MKAADDITEKVSTAIQKFLKCPPVIIWGSGATVPYGLPTMNKLNDALKAGINGFDANNNNLETELGEVKYEKQMPEIKKIIWDTINMADCEIRKNIINGGIGDFSAILNMIKKFKEAHPKVLNIITTNYDRVLEHIMGYHCISFTDGFGGQEFSLFCGDLFKKKNSINLIKVHGSLNWFQLDSKTRKIFSNDYTIDPTIIPPSKNKYQEAFKEPYRDLISKSDAFINNAGSFLVVGFGFNDEHLTPKIKERVTQGTPLVLITKKITDSCHSELENAKNCILLEESKSFGCTTVKYKNNNLEETLEIRGDYWQLGKLMEVLGHG